MLMSVLMKAMTVMLTQSVPTQLGVLLARVMQVTMVMGSAVVVNMNIQYL